MSELTNDEKDLLNGIDMNLTKEIVTKEKNDILQRLPLDRDSLKTIHKKLKGYRYINNLDDFKIGNYVRWINLAKLIERENSSPIENEEEESIEIKLTNGGFICDIVENTNGKPNLLCRNNFNRLFEVSLNKCIVFQKLNNHENIIMSILQYINK